MTSYRDKRMNEKNNLIAKRETNLGQTVERLSKQLQSQAGDENQLSESAQAIETLNKDVKDVTGFSTIDQNTDLDHNQVIAITKLESLSKLDFMEGDESTDEDPVEKITRIFQRKQVSKNRQGRKEAIQMFQEMEQKKDSRGFWEKWFSPKE